MRHPNPDGIRRPVDHEKTSNTLRLHDHGNYIQAEHRGGVRRGIRRRTRRPRWL